MKKGAQKETGHRKKHSMNKELNKHMLAMTNVFTSKDNSSNLGFS